MKMSNRNLASLSAALTMTVLATYSLTAWVMAPKHPPAFQPYQLWIVGERELEEPTGQFAEDGTENVPDILNPGQVIQTPHMRAVMTKRKYFQLGTKDGKVLFLIPNQ